MFHSCQDKSKSIDAILRKQTIAQKPNTIVKIKVRVHYIHQIV